MSPTGHFAVGLVAKRFAPKVPLGVLLLATEVIDLFFFLFLAVGVENGPPKSGPASTPWSHSLFMAMIWSALAALLAARIYRNSRSGAVIGLLVFSHWVLDFISHPMSGGPPDLPLLFDASPKVGLGLFSSFGGLNSLNGIVLATLFELGMLILGFVFYMRWRRMPPAGPVIGKNKEV